MDRFRKFAGSLILLILACASCAWAQPAPAANSIRSSPNGGTVTGTVKDTTGAMIPGANVTLTDDSGGTLQASSGSDGTYTIRGVPPGTYSVSVTLPGLAQNGGVAISVSTGQIA